MLDSLMPDEPAAPLELTPFVAAMPSGVREEIDRARRGEGPCAGWYRGHARHGRVRACNALANRVELASETFGWIVGITAFDDARQEVAGTLRRASFRDAAIPPALEAMATGIAAGRPTTPKLWATIEALAGRLPVVPKSLASALPSGVVSRYAIVRGAALRLAQKLGTAGREAIAAARGRSVGAELALLDDALAVLAGGHVAPAPTIDDVALLARLLEAWRATRDPELERAIDRAGAAIARARGAIEAKSKSELEAAWLAVAANGDAADVTRLLDAPWPSFAQPAAARVRALAAFAPDPRIAVGVIAAARRYHSNALCRDALAIAERAATQALLPELDALSAVVQDDDHYTWGLRAQQIEALRGAVLAMQPAAADPELLAEAARLDERGEVDTLLAEVWANPGDLGARAVLADAMQLAGDPRGTFIALQLAIARGTVEPQAIKQADTLLAQRGDVWAGPLPGVDPRTRRFERGFLVSAITTASQTLIARSLERPEWRTLEELAVMQPIDLAPLLARVPLLSRLGARASALQQLAERGVPLSGIRTVFTDDAWQPPRELFPDLEVLGVMVPPGTTDARVLLEAPVRALVAFCDATTARQLISDRRAGPPELRIVLDAWDGRFTAMHTCAFRFRRDEPKLADVAQGRSTSSVDDRAVLETLRTVGVERIATYQSVPRLLFHESWLGVEIVPGAPIDIAA